MSYSQHQLLSLPNRVLYHQYFPGSDEKVTTCYDIDTKQKMIFPLQKCITPLASGLLSFESDGKNYLVHPESFKVLASFADIYHGIDKGSETHITIFDHVRGEVDLYSVDDILSREITRPEDAIEDPLNATSTSSVVTTTPSTDTLVVRTATPIADTLTSTNTAPLRPILTNIPDSDFSLGDNIIVIRNELINLITMERYPLQMGREGDRPLTLLFLDGYWKIRTETSEAPDICIPECRECLQMNSYHVALRASEGQGWVTTFSTEDTPTSK